MKETLKKPTTINRLINRTRTLSMNRDLQIGASEICEILAQEYPKVYDVILDTIELSNEEKSKVNGDIELYFSIIEHIENKKKINAIKAVRQYSGFSLKEAKEWVEGVDMNELEQFKKDLAVDFPEYIL